MPYLIKKVESELMDNIEGIIPLIYLHGEMGVEDYINVNNFIGFTQNFNKVIKTEVLPNFINFGLKNNTKFIELKINY